VGKVPRSLVVLFVASKPRLLSSYRIGLGAVYLDENDCCVVERFCPQVFTPRHITLTPNPSPMISFVSLA